MFPLPAFDFSEMDDWERLRDTPESPSDIPVRGARLARWLQSRPEERIAVVAHHGFFLGWLGIDLDNCEWRSYDLVGTKMIPSDEK